MDKKTITMDGIEYILTPVEKKEYEILSFRVINSLTLLTKKGDTFSANWAHSYISYTEEEVLNPIEIEKEWDDDGGNYKFPGYEIYSIKRLSDGEVFTIEDKINGTLSVDENIKAGPGFTIIKKFFLDSNKNLCFDVTTGTVLHYPDVNTFSKIRKHIPTKIVLFTTEDGVGIGVGDECFGVNTSRNIYSGRYMWYKREHFGETSLNPYVKYFSTEEKAKDYLETVVKRYSIADIKKAFGKEEDIEVNYILKKLKEL